MSDTRENDELSLCSPFDLVSNEKEENHKKEIKRLQKQLDIAVEGLNQYAKPRNVNMYDGDDTISVGCRYLSDRGEVARKYLQQIEDLNEIHEQA